MRVVTAKAAYHTISKKGISIIRNKCRTVQIGQTPQILTEDRYIQASDLIRGALPIWQKDCDSLQKRGTQNLPDCKKNLLRLFSF